MVEQYSTVGIYHTLCIRSPVDGHLGCFPFLSTINWLLSTCVYKSVYRHMGLFPLDGFLGEECLGRRMELLKTHPSYFSPALDESFSDLTSSTLAIVSLFTFSHPQVWWNLMMTVTFIYPMTHVVKEKASHTQTGRKHLQNISLEKDVYF